MPRLPDEMLTTKIIGRSVCSSLGGCDKEVEARVRFTGAVLYST
jgi:hypothetical protein